MINTTEEPEHIIHLYYKDTHKCIITNAGAEYCIQISQLFLVMYTHM